MISYIIKALREYNTIYVNELGTFSVQYVSANIVGNTIQPPHNNVVFDSNTHHEEMVFTNLVCREKQCLMTQATMQISQWVEELKSALNHNKSVSFEDFGTFSLNEKGRLSFSCERIDALNQEFEGMHVLTPSAVGVANAFVSNEDVQEQIPDHTEEEERIKREAEERLRQAEEEERLKREAEERLRQAEEEERLKREAEERLRQAEEEERLKREAEERLRQAEEEERLKREAEERLRQAEEEERLKREAEERLRQAEEEERLKREAEERLRQAEEEERLKREAEERLRQAEEEECLKREAEERQRFVEEEQKEEEKEESSDEENDEEKEQITTPKKKHNLAWLFILLIIIALAVLGYLFRNQIGTVYQNMVEKFKKTPQTEVVEDSDAADDSPAEEVATDVAKPEKETPVVYEPTVLKTTADGKYKYIQFENGHYYAIAGSLPSESEAVLHIRQKGLDQYNPCFVVQDGVSNVRVCIGVFDTEEEAESFAKGINSKYWVLK